MGVDFERLPQTKENLRVSCVAELDGLAIELKHPWGGVGVTPVVVVGVDSGGHRLHLQLRGLAAHRERESIKPLLQGCNSHPQSWHIGICIATMVTSTVVSSHHPGTPSSNTT